MKPLYFLPVFILMIAVTFLAAKAADVKIARKEMVLAEEINLPYYGNFDEVTGRSVEFDTLMQQFVPADTRLLAVYIDRDDLDVLSKDPHKGFQKYIMVQTMKQGSVLEGAGSFALAKEAFIKQMEMTSLNDMPEVGSMMENVSDYVQKNYNADMRVNVGANRILGKIVDTDDRIGYLTQADVETTGNIKKYSVAGVTIIQNVRGRLLFVYAYLSDFQGAEDLDWIKKTGLSFSDKLARANMSVDARRAERGSAVRTVILICLGALCGVMTGVLAMMRRRQKKGTAV